MLTASAPRVGAGLPTRRAPLIAGAVAAVLAVVYLLTPHTGQDLAAQLFRADFAREHPLTPVDLRWFGGTTTFGYSWWAPIVMAWVGVRLVGAICCVLATVQTTVLLARGRASRPLVGGVLVALTQTVNLVAGRVTFSLGMVCGLAALLVLSRASGRIRRFPAVVAVKAGPPATTTAGKASRRKGRFGTDRPGLARLGLVGLLAFLAGAASPVAALLLWVCAAALTLTGSLRAALTVLVPSLVPVLVGAWLFGEGGTQSFSGASFRDAVIATGLVAILVPWRARLVRVGALVGLAMLVAAFVLPTPVGDNSLRLSMLFAVPVVGAFVTWRPWLTGFAVIATALPQQIGSHYSFTYGPSASASYYVPLIDEIRSRGPVVGRVEIPETEAHWDAAYVARAVPLARGWLRQLDKRLNEHVLFSPHFPPGAYRDFLRANAVQYVAVPDANPTASGRQEADAVRAGLPYLRAVWSNAHWTLYAVRRPTPIVAAPGRFVSMDASSITLDAPAHASVPVSLRWSRWLTVSGAGCVVRGAHGHVVVHTGSGGRLVLGSRLFGDRQHC